MPALLTGQGHHPASARSVEPPIGWCVWLEAVGGLSGAQDMGCGVPRRLWLQPYRDPLLGVVLS